MPLERGPARAARRTRPRAGSAVALSLLLAALGLGACSDAEERRAAREGPLPNFILLSVDTLRRSALGNYDPAADALPAIDGLARSSARFMRAYSTSSWTLPAHASMLTGLHPDRHALVFPKTYLDPGILTLAQALTAAGYRATAFTDGGFASPKFGFDKGFADYHVREKRAAGRPAFARVVDFLAERPDGAEPFFLFLQTYRVHDYYKVSRAAAERVPPGTSFRGMQSYLDLTLGKQAGGADQWAALRALYRAELRLLDGAVEELLGALEDLGLADSTFVLFVSDHGEGFDPERARTGHGGRLHEDLVRIPAFLRGPGIAPQDVSTPFSLVDVMPTILDLAGLPVPADVDGVSLAAVLAGRSAPEDRALYATDHAFLWEDGRRRMLDAAEPAATAVAVIRSDWWYIATAGGEEVYDMSADPSQSRNLTAQDARALPDLRGLAEERRSLAREPLQRSGDADLDRELRALGYVE